MLAFGGRAEEWGIEDVVRVMRMGMVGMRRVEYFEGKVGRLLVDMARRQRMRMEAMRTVGKGDRISSCWGDEDGSA